MVNKPKDIFGADIGVGLSLGVQLAAVVAVSAFIGYKIDEYFGIKPWGIALGVIFGSIFGIVDVVRLAFIISIRQDKKRDE